jgi:hypothetical protein
VIDNRGSHFYLAHVLGAGARRADRRRLVLSVLLPMSLMLYSPYGYDVRCTAEERTCIISERFAFETERTSIAFDDIKVIKGFVEWAGEGNERHQTGRSAFDFVRKNGAHIDASLFAHPEELQLDALRAYVRAPDAPFIEVSTRLPKGDIALFAALFVFGLMTLAASRWTTVVSRDPATGTVVVTRHLWPLLKRTTFSARADAIADVHLSQGEWWHTLTVRLGDGSTTRVARSAFLGRLEELASALRSLKGQTRRDREARG